MVSLLDLLMIAEPCSWTHIDVDLFRAQLIMDMSEHSRCSAGPMRLFLAVQQLKARAACM